MLLGTIMQEQCCLETFKHPNVDICQENKAFLQDQIQTKELYSYSEDKFI